MKSRGRVSNCLSNTKWKKNIKQNNRHRWQQARKGWGWLRWSPQMASQPPVAILDIGSPLRPQIPNPKHLGPRQLFILWNLLLLLLNFYLFSFLHHILLHFLLTFFLQYDTSVERAPSKPFPIFNSLPSLFSCRSFPIILLSVAETKFHAFSKDIFLLSVYVSISCIFNIYSTYTSQLSVWGIW